MIPDIRIEDYNYPLPDDRIAKYPLAERDSSKLLRYENGVVKEYVFREIPELLPSDAVMVFNDTKVVPAFQGKARQAMSNFPGTEIFLSPKSLKSAEQSLSRHTLTETAKALTLKDIRRFMRNSGALLPLLRPDSISRRTFSTESSKKALTWKLSASMWAPAPSFR